MKLTVAIDNTKMAECRVFNGSTWLTTGVTTGSSTGSEIGSTVECVVGTTSYIAIFSVPKPTSAPTTQRLVSTPAPSGGQSGGGQSGGGGGGQTGGAGTFSPTTGPPTEPAKTVEIKF